MNYQILVNKDNPLDKTYVPSNLIDSKSKYKDNVLLEENALKAFKRLQTDALKLGYEIDIESGYRTYEYQENLFESSVNERGYANTIRNIAPPGCSEHQTGLAIDICIYKDNKCLIDYDIENTEELNWMIDNCHNYGYILRYPEDKENITGYNYEPWHYRYIGELVQKITTKFPILEETINKLSE